MDKLKDITGVTGSGRTMKFPYTATAQFRQFPWKFYFNNQWIFRYWCFGVITCFPLFVYISGLANSPENVKKFADSRAKEKAEAAAHFDH